MIVPLAWAVMIIFFIMDTSIFANPLVATGLILTIQSSVVAFAPSPSSDDGKEIFIKKNLSRMLLKPSFSFSHDSEVYNK